MPTTEPLPIPSLDDVLAPARDAMHDAVLDRIRTAPRGGPVAAVGDGGPLGPATDPMATTPEGTPPRLLTMPEPSYPAALRAAGTEGAVELEYVVDVTGRVDTNSVRVLGPAPAPGFVTAARVALAAARFAPARVAGQPSAARVRQRLVFRLTRAP
ncbi:MAG TPA: TonB family protein [Gemmatimonadales bacterium]|nr:TonB family protein [Gemmatimonadales bacterium]